MVSFFFFGNSFSQRLRIGESDSAQVLHAKKIYAFYFSKQGDEEKKLVRWGRRGNLSTGCTGSQILPVFSRLVSVPAAFCSICYLRPVPYLWAAEIRLCPLLIPTEIVCHEHRSPV